MLLEEVEIEKWRHQSGGKEEKMDRYRYQKPSLNYLWRNTESNMLK